MRARLWPTGLIGRVGFVLLAALGLEFVGSAVLFEQAETFIGDENQAQRIAADIDVAVRVLALTPVGNRPGVAGKLSEQGLSLSWRREDDTLPTPDMRSEALRRRIVAAEPKLSSMKLAPVEHGLVGTVSLPDGSHLAFRTATPPAPPFDLKRLWSIGLLSSGVLLAALLVVRTLAAPLRLLVSAADAIGRGPAVAVAEHGPRDVRRVASAFNAMQARIAKLVEDRTQALAAVSHDLRTPIGRMRLRAGFIDAGEDRAAFEADLDEMEVMLADLLAYLGGEADPEKPRRTDLAVTLAMLVDDATDAGREASYEGPDHLVVQARALALKRALSNILGNALSYGHRARATLRVAPGEVIVTVDDDGPGIPEAEMEAVFEPFYRVDASRNRASGGMGLGLAIARQAIQRDNGTIVLENRAEQGLRVVVTLPRPKIVLVAPDG